MYFIYAYVLDNIASNNSRAYLPKFILQEKNIAYVFYYRIY